MRKTALNSGRYVMVEAHTMATQTSTIDQIEASTADHPASRAEKLFSLGMR